MMVVMDEYRCELGGYSQCSLLAKNISRAVASGDYCQEGERGGGREIAGMARVTSWEEPALPQGWLQ